MNKQIKAGFIVTVHHSEERPQGQEFIIKFCKTLIEYCTHDIIIYVIDNGSFPLIKMFEDSRIKLIRIEDEDIGGITFAWNLGINIAQEEGCEILVNCGDDMYFNESINKFLDYIKLDMDEDTIYSCLTDGLFGGSIQKSNTPQVGVTQVSCKQSPQLINGFFFGMTKSHYKKYRIKKDKYFSSNNRYVKDENHGKWAGQEGQFQENSDKGLKGLVINECWLPHIKLRSWVKKMKK